MKKLYLAIAIVLFTGFSFISGKLCAQDLTSATALNLVKANASAIGLSKTDLANMRISSAYMDKASGAYLVYVQQTYKGSDVFNAVQTYAFKNGKLASAANKPITNMADIASAKDAKASVTP